MEHFSASCRHGTLLFRDDNHKQIMLNSLVFMALNKRIWLYGFVILEDEIHLLWKKQPAWEERNVRQMLLKFTAQQIKHRLRGTNPKELELYKCQRHDRLFQFWEASSSGAPVPDGNIAAEKLQQMHEAPYTSGICYPGSVYPYSSAAFYHAGEDPLKAMTHYHQYFPP